jgi:DNA-directed RNA polymerase specialized sigma24 family protein
MENLHRIDFSAPNRACEGIQDEFEEPTWQAFWRVAVEDQSPADVAPVLGLSVNAVYLAKSRVLRRLREALGDEDSQ